MSTGNQKIALVTGATRRIGAEIARTLHSRGLDLILHYRSAAESAEQIAAEFNELRPGSTRILSADFEDPGQLDAMIGHVQTMTDRLDVLANNASTFEPSTIGNVDGEQWKRIMASNLRAPFFLSQALQPQLARAKGCIVNLVDIHGERPLRDYSVYCIAKAGLSMMTKSMAREMGPDVRVNGVAPGSILWPEEGLDESARRSILERTALKRRGEPEDIAAAVAFLALEAPYVTGEILKVDGGRSLNM